MRVFFLMSCLLVLLTQPGWAFELSLLHVNDSHSYLESTEHKLTIGGEQIYAQLGGWTRIATVVNDVRSEKANVALLHAGDAVQGDLYFMKYGGKPEMEFLSRLDFDAMTLGNHEFDKGAATLVRILENTDIPILSANMDAAGFPKLAKRVKPYTILTFGTEKVGVIGLTNKETVFISSAGSDVDFANEAETARRYVKELQTQGINKIVLLTHMGLEHDKQLAPTVAGVDVIVSGHHHTLLADPAAMKALGQNVDGTYPVVVKGADGTDVYVVSAWKWGRVLGRLDLIFDDAGQVTSAIGRPTMIVANDFKRKDAADNKVAIEGETRQNIVDIISDSGVAKVVDQDPLAAAFLEPFSEGVKGMRDEIIGVATKSLPHIKVPGVTETGLSLPHGSLIAPIVAQSMLDKINSTGNHADIALQNAGGVRESIHQGTITLGTAYTTLPFDNTLYIMEITGAELKGALENGVSCSRGAFPYLAGARLIVDMKKATGSRIRSMDVMDRTGKWQLLNPGRTYTLVTNSYLANGGDCYGVLKNATKRYDTGFGDAQAFIDYVREKGKISPSFTGMTYIPAK